MATPSNNAEDPEREGLLDHEDGATSCGHLCCHPLANQKITRTDSQGTLVSEIPQEPPAHRSACEGHAKFNSDPEFQGAAFQSVCCVAFYPEEVHELAKRMCEKKEKVSAAWCVGPVMRLAMYMPLVYSLSACVVAGSTGMLSSCDKGTTLKWPWWIWLFWLPIGTGLLSVEFQILKHLSVPHYFKGEGWKTSPSEMVSKVFNKCGMKCEGWENFKKNRGFLLWCMWCFFLSGVRMLSFFSANMFIGMVLGDAFWHTCGDQTVEKVWEKALEHSRFWPSWASATTLYSIFIFMFVAQIIHFLLGGLFAWPRWWQWHKGGKKPPEKVKYEANPTYEQDFEFGIIEYLSYRKGDERRPQGTRFSYVPLLGNEVTSSAAIETIAEACGMAAIVKTSDVSFVGYRKALNILSTPDWGDIEKAITETRKLIQDARVLLRTTLSHIFFYGICVSGLVLQAQVTYYHARCFEEKDGKMVRTSKDCTDTSGLLVGVLAGFLTVLMTIDKGFKVMTYIWDVHRVKQEYQGFHKKHESVIHTNEEMNMKHGQVLSLSWGLVAYSLLIIPVVFLFFLNFAWVATKFFMATFVCEDRIWDVNFDLRAGCVDVVPDVVGS